MDPRAATATADWTLRRALIASLHAPLRHPRYLKATLGSDGIRRQKTTRTVVRQWRTRTLCPILAALIQGPVRKRASECTRFLVHAPCLVPHVDESIQHRHR